MQPYPQVGHVPPPGAPRQGTSGPAKGVGGWWVVRAGRQHPTAAVLAPADAGSFRVGDLGNDPGVAALFDAFARASQRQQQGDLPPWMRSLQQMGANSGGSPTAGLRMLLPTEAAVSVERGAGGEPAIVAAVNPRGMSFLLRTLLEKPARSTETYHGEQVLQLDDHAWAAAVDGTFLFANDAQALRGGIDRLRAGSAVTAPPVVDLGAPTRAWDLTGTLVGDDGDLARLLWDDAPPDARSGVERARVGVDVATADLVVGRVVVDCASPEAAAAAARALDERARERAQSLAADGLDLRAAVRV